MAELRYDVVVVGGGLVGRAAAVLSARRGHATLHLAPKGPPDRRTSALMQPSVDWLVAEGLVGAPADLGNRLSRIRIIDATDRLIRAPETLFDSAEVGIEAFGWNFANMRLAESFEAAAAGLDRLETRDVAVKDLTFVADGAALTLADGKAVTASLVVGADGRRSLVRQAAGLVARERAFEQAALVVDLDLERPLDGESVEFHYPQGPFTLVPAAGNRANLVWIDKAAILAEAKALPPEALIDRLVEKSQRLFGRISTAGPVQVFPLSTLSVEPAGRAHVTLVGESAHAFPPIGAQGLNLGLRDVADLGRALANASGAEWAKDVGLAYAQLRRTDLARTGQMVDSLFRSLLSPMLPAQAVRAGGLWALNLLPPLRRKAFALGMGQR